MNHDVPKLLKPLVANGSAAAIRELLAWSFRGFIVLSFFWLKATFVSVEAYNADRGKTLETLMNISNTLTRIDEKMSKGANVDADHEARLRVLEHGKPSPR